MSTSAFKYSKFAFNITFKKISTFILPILVLAFSLIIGLVYKFVVGQRYYDLAKTYIFIFTNATATVIFSSIKALNIFKDFDSEGLEIITLSKPISEKQLNSWKTFNTNILWTYMIFSYANCFIIWFVCNFWCNKNIFSRNIIFICWINDIFTFWSIYSPNLL